MEKIITMKKSNLWLLGAGLFVLATSCGGDKENGENSLEENGETIEQNQDAQSQGQEMVVPQNQGDMNQADYSDDVLKDFMKIDQRLQMVQQEKQGQMVEMVEASDITVEDYQKISAAQQQGQSTDEFTDGQMKVFNELNGEISTLENSMMTEFEEIIVDEGYDMDSYRSMAENISASQELQQRLQNLMMAEQPNQQQIVQ